MFLAVAFAVVISLAASGQQGTPSAAAAIIGNCIPGSDWPVERADLAAEVVVLVNQHRASIGLQPLVASPTLTASAVWKSRHMAKYGYMAHSDPAPPVARGAFDRTETCGYPANSSQGENIAYGYPTARAVMDGWLASPGHRQNIEGASFRAIGVGAAFGSMGFAWTQNFGSVDDSAGYHRAGAMTCGAVTPQFVASAPTIYGFDTASQYVFWRTLYWRLNGSTWQQAGVSPYYVSVATRTSPAAQWWEYPSGVTVGGSSQLRPGYSTVPPGGLWVAFQEFHWFTPAGTHVATDYEYASETSGPNSSGGYCSWP